MSTPMINSPKGLVSLLGLRDMGGVPRALLSDLQAGIDITQFLLLDRETLVMSPVPAVGATGAAVAYTVPPGELWYVHEYGIRSVPLLAGERLGLCTMTQAVNSGVATVNGTPNIVGSTGDVVACHIRDSFWLNAGGTLAYQCVAFTSAGTIGISPTAVISRLRI